MSYLLYLVIEIEVFIGFVGIVGIVGHLEVSSDTQLAPFLAIQLCRQTLEEIFVYQVTLTIQARSRTYPIAGDHQLAGIFVKAIVVPCYHSKQLGKKFVVKKSFANTTR
jgi:hypothetical protein